MNNKEFPIFLASDMNKLAEESRRQLDFEEYIDAKEEIYKAAKCGENDLVLEKKISDSTKIYLEHDGFAVSFRRVPDCLYEGHPAYITIIQW